MDFPKEQKRTIVTNMKIINMSEKKGKSLHSNRIARTNELIMLNYIGLFLFHRLNNLNATAIALVLLEP
jgi:hypothetical protein